MKDTPGVKTDRDKILRQMRRIADSRVNDAVKLAFLDSGLDRRQMEEIVNERVRKLTKERLEMTKRGERDFYF